LDPDREFVDAGLRSGTWAKDHPLFSGISPFFHASGRVGVEVFPELRTQTRPGISAFPMYLWCGGGEHRSLRYAAPLIAIEILREDTVRAMQGKAAEYSSFGVENIWIIDRNRG